MKYYKQIGNHGEEFATTILIDKGFEIIDRNYRCRSGEIDIVAFKDDVYHFVEVKTRTSDEYGEPVEAVDSRKQMHIKRTAEYYMLSHKLKEYMVQFDVIELSVNMLWGCF